MSVHPYQLPDLTPMTSKVRLDDHGQAVCGRLFAHIRSRLNGLTPTQFHLGMNELSNREYPEQYDYVRQRVRKLRSKSHISYAYPENFLAYDRRFFYRNLFKYLVTAYIYHQKGYPVSANRLVDIGAGTGTFSLAWLTILHHFQQRFPNEVILNDTASLQNVVAPELLRLFYPGTGIFLDCREVLFNDRASPDQLYLYGYVLHALENRQQVVALADRRAVVVDYDEVVQMVAQARRMTAPAQHFRINAKVPSHFLKAVKSLTVEVNTVAA